GLLEKGMQESAQAAMSYIRARQAVLGLPEDFYQQVDVHVHFPEFVPKDGPSAGITMATSIASALIKAPVRRDVAMTGEITLRGRVLPIGGLKEKLLAAHRASVRTVLVPRDNEKDLNEVPKRVLRALRIILVEHMDQVLRAALNADAPLDALDAQEEGRAYVVPEDSAAEEEDDDALLVQAGLGVSASTVPPSAVQSACMSAGTGAMKRRSGPRASSGSSTA
ncbi:MAG: S16 family serine protease, partial [Polyangiales bacterium]